MSSRYEGTLMKTGKTGEHYVMDYLRSKKAAVEDLTDDPYYQAKDIDCRITPEELPDANITLEIKTDTYITGEDSNFVFELMRINKTDNLPHAWQTGWSFIFEADYLMVYCPNYDNVIYRIHKDHFIQRFQAYAFEQKRYLNICVKETDNVKLTLFVLIPIRYFKHKDPRKFCRFKKTDEEIRIEEENKEHEKS